jgi:hypothetical protein
MRFPHSDDLAIPAQFVRYVPGDLHPDGRRYLPRLIFELPGGVQLSVVDRHHYVDPGLAGRHGVARLVFLLSTLRLQPGEQRRRGIVPESRGVASAPDAYGRVVDVPGFEIRRDHLPYQTLFTELLLDVGDGIVGVRTSMTAPDIATRLGAERLMPGDWLHVSRSRIDDS